MESFRSAIATCSVMSPAPRPWTRIQQQGDTRQTRSSSVLNGIVLVSHINFLRQQKREMSAATHATGADRRDDFVWTEPSVRRERHRNC